MLKLEHTKAFYTANMGKKVIAFRGQEAEIITFSMSGQSGSWMRGFKFHNSKWAMLKRVRIIARRKHGVTKRTDYSMDGGRSWWSTMQAARQMTKKGRIKLSTDTKKEFAYDAIQRINKEYDY